MNKKITICLLTAISIVVVNSSSAQDKKLVDIKKINSLKPGSHITDSSSTKFIGTWKYENGTEEIILILAKIVSNVGSGPNHIEMEIVNGGYKYVKQGKELFNTLLSKPLYGTTSKMNDDISLSITNTTTGKETLLIGKLIDKNTMQLKLNDKQGEGILPDKNLDFLFNLKFIRQK